MRIQKIWITPFVLVALNLLSQTNSQTLAHDEEIAGYHPASQANGTAIITRDDENIPGIIPITSENISLNTSNGIAINAHISSKGTDVKTNEGKKKLLGFGRDTGTPLKLKNETKFYKPKDGKSTAGRASVIIERSSTEPTSIFLPTVQSISNIDNETNKTIDSTFPFLLHGEPHDNDTVLAVKKTIGSSSIDITNLTRGRALNVSTPDITNSLYANITDLSDVSMDEEDKEIEGGEYVAIHKEMNATIVPIIITNTSVCMEGNKTYAVGENIVRGCDEKCVCEENGKIKNCTPLCMTPHVRAGKTNRDAFCHERTVDAEGCCAIVVCTDSAPEAEETCLFGNETLIRGQRIEDGCTKVCECQSGGSLKCQPRCPPNDTNSALNHHDRCVALADPRDSCCTITYCDVSLGEDEIKSENVSDLAVSLTDIKILNSTAIKLKLSSELTNETHIEISENNHLWRQQKLEGSEIISRLEPAHSYYVRIREGGRTGPALRVMMPAEVIKTNLTEKLDKNSCSHRGKIYKIGAEWYDECLSICMCNEGAKTECITIECPTDFGLDVLDPHCLDWETVPPNFFPKAPNCCPQEVRCRNNGSCSYGNKTYDNWSEIPSNVTGCENRCSCEMGKVSCQLACPPVPALPPTTLKCLANEAILAKFPNDDCCTRWVCNHSASSIPGKNATSAYVNPMAIDMNDRPPVDDNKRANNKSVVPAKPTQEPDGSDVSALYSWQNEKSPFTTTHPVTHPGLFHYPMDPGHPTISYNGPYNPDYTSTEANAELIFQLPGRYQEKLAPPLKDKSKSKNDAKKHAESIKPHKEIIEQQIFHHHTPSTQQTYLGPLSPDKFPIIPNKINENTNENTYFPPKNPNKHLLKPPKSTFSGEHSQFTSFKGSDSSSFPFSPNNGENIPPTKFNPNQFDTSDLDSPYHDIQSVTQRPSGTHDPNYVIVPNGAKKKIPSGDTLIDQIKSKQSLSSPGKIKSDGKKPGQEIIPDELLHLINIHHPGLTQLDNSPGQGHPDLYEFHQQMINQPEPPTNQIPLGYFGHPISGSKKINPKIVAHKNENGETTYHIHTSDVPNSPQQIEELLAQISQHDSSNGPLQHYPDRPPIGHNYPNGLSVSPPHIDFHAPNSGVPHLNHPLTVQTSIQSGIQDHNFHGGFPINSAIPEYTGHASGQSSSSEIIIKAIDPIDDRTVRVIFTVSPVLVGLHGRVELRYTNDKSNQNPATWKSQVFIPPNDLIATPQLEFNLDGLEPATEYNVKVTVNLRDLANSPTSKIYTVRTPAKFEEHTTLPPQIPIDAELGIMETNSSWVKAMWKKFTEYEMQFIDGVQLRYKERDGKVYAATPLIHRAVTSYMIENLKPATTYEIGISIIPFPGQTTELISEKTIQITTAVEPDPYSFDVKIEIKAVKSQDVEISWTGVPYPQDKYVNIYRAIYQSDSGKGDTSTFKIAKRDSTAKTIINDLKPGTRYRLWLEIYLTNGRIKKSNVQDFITKPGVILPAGVSQQGKLASISLHEGDYYGPLVIVAIVASLAILSTLILLMILMKRRSSSKADISPRKTTSAYDNPSYKTCEDSVTIANDQNKVTEHEMSAINSNIISKESA